MFLAETVALFLGQLRNQCTGDGWPNVLYAMTSVQAGWLVTKAPMAAGQRCVRQPHVTATATLVNSSRCINVHKGAAYRHGSVQ